jgi:hypothetical protein
MHGPPDVATECTIHNDEDDENPEKDLLGSSTQLESRHSHLFVVPSKSVQELERKLDQPRRLRRQDVIESR